MKADLGLPVHSLESLLLDAGLANVSMLRERRLQPAPGQQPVGQYWSGHAWVGVYRRDDAVAMPPMSPGRQRLYDAARTCKRCGKTSRSPWRRGRDGCRYCVQCVTPAGEELWAQERAQDRPVIARWAREVLDDPTTVLLAIPPETSHYWFDLIAVDLAGATVLEIRVRYADEVHADNPEAARLAGSVTREDAIQQLEGRRTVAWSDGWQMHKLPVSDALGKWYSRWLGQPNGPLMITLGAPGFRWYPEEQDARKKLATMRQALDEMAADDSDTTDEPGHAGSDGGGG